MLRKLGHRIALVVATSIAVALPLPAAASAADDGRLRVTRDAKTSFNSILTDATDVQRLWMNSHYWRMRGYQPFFDRALGWAPGAHFYQDLYAIKPAKPEHLALLAEHPDWVLRDSAGNKLYIQFACNGTSCSQYAADIGNPQWRAWWINQARAVMDNGYEGIFVDDVNLAIKVSNGAGEFVRPMDPRTGAPMTDANWRRYMAEFTEQIRAAFPTKEIVHNSLWTQPHSDPYVQRQTDAADIIEMERGFNDAGITGGTGTFGYETYLKHVDWLHSRGASVMYQPYGLTPTSREFEVASYYLVKAMDDSIVPDLEADPGNWWSGWDTDLGAPSGPRYAWNGLIRRDFANGSVLVNQPGATTKTVTLPSVSTWKDLSGATVSSVTLGARQGKVLTKAGSTPPPPSDTTPPDTQITGGPSGTITTASASFTFTSSESGSSFSCRIDGAAWSPCASPKSYSGLAEGAHTFDVRATDAAGNVDSTPASRTFTVDLPDPEPTPEPTPEPNPEPPTIKPGKGRVKKGGTITLTGSTATGADARLADAATTVRVESKRRGGSWKVVKRAVAVDGTYRAKVKARRAGVHRYRAIAAELPSSRVVQVRVVG